MSKYVATILIDIDESLGFVHKRSSKDSIKGLLESRIHSGAVDEVVFRNGNVVLQIKEVNIFVMKID